MYCTILLHFLPQHSMPVSLFNFPVCILSHIKTYLISQIPDLVQLITFFLFPHWTKLLLMLINKHCTFKVTTDFWYDNENNPLHFVGWHNGIQQKQQFTKRHAALLHMACSEHCSIVITKWTHTINVLHCIPHTTSVYLKTWHVLNVFCFTSSISIFQKQNYYWMTLLCGVHYWLKGNVLCGGYVHVWCTLLVKR